MYGYKLALTGLPETVYACTTHVDNYSWANHNDPDTIEIAICDAPWITRTIHEEICTTHGGTVFACNAGGDPVSAFSGPGVPVDITSVAVRFPKLSVTAGALTEEDLQDTSVLLLPSFAEDFPDTDEIRCLLRSYISHSVKDSAADRATCISIWFELAALIDRHMRMPFHASQETGANYYVKKVDAIIRRQYASTLRLQEIARELGITTCYLSAVYSQTTGNTFCTALLKMRMDKALELASGTTLSVREIGAQIGMEDESHLRKCFKKHAGVSISEHRRINRELTLYHAKPQRETSQV